MQARQGAYTLLVEKIGVKILDRKARPVFEFYSPPTATQCFEDNLASYHIAMVTQDTQAKASTQLVAYPISQPQGTW
jgi:hypothetical protein